MLEWTKQRLAELATGLALLTPEANNGLQLTVTGLDSVTGEVRAVQWSHKAGTLQLTEQTRLAYVS